MGLGVPASEAVAADALLVLPSMILRSLLSVSKKRSPLAEAALSARGFSASAPMPLPPMTKLKPAAEISA